jgi:glucosyl-dolichyl phosphate glucuronosyltransferase
MRDVEKLTVAICSHNRARLLRGTLNSLAFAELPAQFDWEVLVVLNACSDDSAAVVREFATRLPVRAVAEPEHGLSVARNCAIESATGDFMLWIDDDVHVAPDWLRRYEAAILAWPGTAFLGGSISVRPEAPVAPWFDAVLPAIGSVFAHLPLDGVEDGAPMAGKRALPFGTNFAIRTEVQRRHRYNPYLGRSQGKYLRNHEETSVLTYVLGDGHEGRWVPTARVEHVVPVERQTAAHIRAYFVGNGIVRGLQARNAGQDVGLPSLIADSRRAIVTELRYQLARRLRPPHRWARRLLKASDARGEWLGKYGPRPFALPSSINF